MYLRCITHGRERLETFKMIAERYKAEEIIIGGNLDARERIGS